MAVRPQKRLTITKGVLGLILLSAWVALLWLFAVSQNYTLVMGIFLIGMVALYLKSFEFFIF